jgi:hypothetical protein
MSNVIKLRPDLKTFTIKVFYDEDVMEVEKIELQKRNFGSLSGLFKADLLKDVVYLLDKDRYKYFKGYIKDVRKDITKRKKSVAKKKARKTRSAKVIPFRK